MREEELEIAIKVVIVGNGAVGKSSMIQRYCKGIFTKDYKKTIGVDFLERQIEVDEEEVRLMLWDTAGQEEFDAITKAYYRGAQACVLAFSTTDRDSFLAIKSWKKKVEDECGDVPMVLVQNKIDLLDQAAFRPDEVESITRELGLRLVKTSVKEDINVNQVFTYLAEKYINHLSALEVDDQILPQKTVGFNGILNIGNMKNGHGEKGTITLKATKRKTSSAKKLFRNKCS